MNGAKQDIQQALFDYYVYLKAEFEVPQVLDIERSVDDLFHEKDFRKRIVTMFPPDEREAMKHALLCWFPAFDGNAFAMPAPDGGALLCIDYCLSYLTLDFAFALSDSVSSAASGNLDSAGEGLDYLIACAETLRTGSPVFRERAFFARVKEFTSGPAPDKGDVARYNVYCTSAGMSDFVLLHECAHFLLGHLDATAEVPGSTLGLGRESSVLVYTKAQQQEFEADAKALCYLLEWAIAWADAGKETHFNSEVLLIYPVEAVFLLLGIAETRSPSALPAALRTHPSPRDRIERLRRIYLERLDNPFLNPFIEFIERLWDALA